MEANGGGDLWLLLTVEDVAVLGIALAYSIFQKRRGETVRIADRGAERVYDAEQRDPVNR